jgi:DNA-binding beta-propeller fold protein YncE
MKTTSEPKTIHLRRRLSRLRTIAAAILVVAAAGLAASSMMPPKLPWAVPIVTVGNYPGGTVVDQATNTIYVANQNEISVIDGSRCNAENSQQCSTIATITIGQDPQNPAFPIQLVFDSTTDTIYATLAGGNDNTFAVVNGRRCNARNTSGCTQVPAIVTIPSNTFLFCNGNVPLSCAPALPALDTVTHSLYIPDANDGPIYVLNTTTCNGTHTANCNQSLTPVATMGDSVTVDPSNHHTYVSAGINDSVVSIFDGNSCNATNLTNCNQPPAVSFPISPFPVGPSAIDSSTHTYYLPLSAFADTLDPVAVIDTSTCNATITSGCGNAPPMVQVGSLPEGVILDPATKTVYVLNEESSSVSMFNGATCNAIHPSGCSQPVRILAAGFNPVFYDFNPETHTLYVPSQNTNDVWVLDASKCNAKHTDGCTETEPTTPVGGGPVGIAESLKTKTLYVPNQGDATVSVIDATICNRHHLAGCNHTWQTIDFGTIPQGAGATPRFAAVNNVTNTLYVTSFGTSAQGGSGAVSVINVATCNGRTTSNCGVLATIPIGSLPQQVAVDETTNTIYVVNGGDSTLSVVSGAHCNASDVSGCEPSNGWPAVATGNDPQAVVLNPFNHTLYVANQLGNSVSVFDTLQCNGADTSHCTPVSTFPVGAGPYAVGILFDKNTVFVVNRFDESVSVTDGATCNGTNFSGCPQTSPPAVLIAAFPQYSELITGFPNYRPGRWVAVDQKKHVVYIPVIGDSDVAMLDGNDCRAGHTNDCHVKIVDKRMGGYPTTALVDEATETVYVANDTDGTVSVFGVHDQDDD